MVMPLCSCVFGMGKGSGCVCLLGIPSSWRFMSGECEFYTKNGIPKSFAEPRCLRD
ncbi:hypothetical protein HYC85_029602 [Camellia sinensis]|uniref:Uncharacterized protein n=1 Tax=Camellia sinensis TaxID=4442 RepID=A0A7J7FZQ9_CAMSI|nr:hypothetical protein HYC85_029602 [Camellia sinensis]